MQLVSKIYNLCDHNLPTLQTDGQMDGRHAIPRPRICTKVHCAVKMQYFLVFTCVTFGSYFYLYFLQSKLTQVGYFYQHQRRKRGKAGEVEKKEKEGGNTRGISRIAILPTWELYCHTKLMHWTYNCFTTFLKYLPRKSVFSFPQSARGNVHKKGIIKICSFIKFT